MNAFEHRYAQIGGKIITIKLPQTIRVNTLKTDEKTVIERLTAKGVVLEKIPFVKHGYTVKSTKFSLGASIEYLRGFITPQEAAAQLPVQVLDPKPGETILDMAASPGVKTSQIAQAMGNKGVLFAVEKNNRRVPGMKNNLERLGVGNCIAVNTDASKLRDWKLSFDRVLLDAPCMGNFAKDKDWLGKHALKELDRNALTQKGMLAAAVDLCKKNGTIVYSTCSLEPEENEFIIDWALRTLPVRCVTTGLTIGTEGVTKAFGKRLTEEVKNTRRLWPHVTQTEGFFIAKLVRK